MSQKCKTCFSAILTAEKQMATFRPSYTLPARPQATTHDVIACMRPWEHSRNFHTERPLNLHWQCHGGHLRTHGVRVERPSMGKATIRLAFSDPILIQHRIWFFSRHTYFVKMFRPPYQRGNFLSKIRQVMRKKWAYNTTNARQFR